MKINSFFKFVFLILILSFCFLVIASKSGYYVYELLKKTKLTEESIERFEQDVESGKSIDINNYIVSKDINYNNSISSLGNKISEGIESTVSKGLNLIFKYLSKQIEQQHK